ncbi:hypothetical protein [Natrinema soli]|uniref:hypothetical protein n=1 Tax=Natrinema soli TaxID=1930624 RepID=UPI0023624B47|nr:hypothetical protein [Natrinema soli]
MPSVALAASRAISPVDSFRRTGSNGWIVGSGTVRIGTEIALESDRELRFE